MMVVEQKSALVMWGAEDDIPKWSILHWEMVSNLILNSRHPLDTRTFARSKHCESTRMKFLIPIKCS